MGKRTDRQRAQLRKLRRANKLLEKSCWNMLCQLKHEKQKTLHRVGCSSVEKYQIVKMLSIEEIFCRYDGNSDTAIEYEKKYMEDRIMDFIKKEELISFFVSDDMDGVNLKAVIYIGIPVKR